MQKPVIQYHIRLTSISEVIVKKTIFSKNNLKLGVKETDEVSVFGGTISKMAIFV